MTVINIFNCYKLLILKVKDATYIQQHVKKHMEPTNEFSLIFNSIRLLNILFLYFTKFANLCSKSGTLFYYQNPVDATFSITGPDTLNVGVTGVWTITAAVHDLYSDISLDVLAPLHQPGVMSIDRISIESVGKRNNLEHTFTEINLTVTSLSP